ncbi:MAG: SPOR domain-containing protein, partial [Deltaproteobacteria bacterium]|nr:SPOR domain-containing protein [Deltaproteobacteria bacterium]
MALAHASTGSAEDITVTAGPTFMDAGRNVTAPSSAVAAAEGESAGHKPARSLVTAPRAPAPAVATGWQVQLGAFRSETRAAKAMAALAQTLADLPRAGVLAIDDSKGDGLFRVMVADAFAHRSEAAATCAAIAARGAQCFVARATARAAASVPASRPPSEPAGRKPVAAPLAALAPGVLERLDTLEAENRQLRNEIEALKAERTKPSHAPSSRAGPAAETTAARFVRTDSKFGYDVLDPTTEINRKQRLILERRHDG